MYTCIWENVYLHVKRHIFKCGKMYVYMWKSVCLHVENMFSPIDYMYMCLWPARPHGPGLSGRRPPRRLLAQQKWYVHVST